MSTSGLGRPSIMESSDIIQFLRNKEEPVATPSEVAEHFDVTNQAVNKRLNELADSGSVVKKKVGASAVVYWPTGGYQCTASESSALSPDSVTQ